MSKFRPMLGMNDKLFACWVIFHGFLSSADFFKIIFFKKLFQERNQSFEQYGSRIGPKFCRPDLGSNCLQRSATDDKIRCWHVCLKNNLMQMFYIPKSSHSEDPDSTEFTKRKAKSDPNQNTPFSFRSWFVLPFISELTFSFNEHYQSVKQFGSRSGRT